MLNGIGIGVPFTQTKGLGALIRGLFSNSEVGVWYDPSDFSTMFTDSAGTTPVTAVGQVVGKILDKSGNGFHATQATSTARPVLRQDAGGRYYLDFDGVDDFLSVPLLGLGFNWSVFAGAAVDSIAAGDRTIFSQRSTTSTNPIKAQLDFSTNTSRAYARNDAGTIADGLVYAAAANTPYVLTNTYTDGSQELRANGVQRDTGVITLGATTVTHNSIGRLEIVAPGGFLDGKLYSLIVRGALSDAAQIAAAESYVNSKTGAY